VQDWLKAAVHEVQEYVRLQVATFRAIVSPPYYFRDIVEQFESIGIGSLTVVVLAGFFTGAVLALQTGITVVQKNISNQVITYIITKPMKNVKTMKTIVVQ
jgi:phospholipid/cholesterol/gamma-HCH transport system permease protein